MTYVDCACRGDDLTGREHCILGSVEQTYEGQGSRTDLDQKPQRKMHSPSECIDQRLDQLEMPGSTLPAAVSTSVKDNPLSM